MIKNILVNLQYWWKSMRAEKQLATIIAICMYTLIVIAEPLFWLMPIGWGIMQLIYYISDNYLGGYFVNLVLWGVGIGVIIYSVRALIDNEINSFLYVVGGYFLGIIILKFFEE